MKRVFILLGLAAALQLSAQNPVSGAGNDFQQGSEGQEQVGAPAPGHQGMRGKAFGPQGRPDNRPPMFQEGGMEGLPPFALDQLSDNDRKTVEGYMKDLRKTTGKIENELFLRRAELRYLRNLDKPDINQISAKLDEISKLESSLQLERIKFEIKIKEQFPALIDNFWQRPRHQVPTEGAPSPNANQDRPQPKRK